jgi:anti-sigma B factor antagonist
VPVDPVPPKLLNVQTTRYADRYVVAAAGEVDASTAEALDGELRRAEASDAQRIVLDLSGVTFLDSTGLRLLLQAQSRSQADSNRLRLVRGPRRVQRVFELTNTEQLLPFLN